MYILITITQREFAISCILWETCIIARAHIGVAIDLLLLTDRHYVSFGEELTPVPLPCISTYRCLAYYLISVSMKMINT